MIETAKRASACDKPRFKLLAEAAMELRKGERWLRDWIKQNPCDARGEAYYALPEGLSYSPISISIAYERACHAPYARPAESWAHAELPHPG
jgi:hypothetical protein